MHRLNLTILALALLFAAPAFGAEKKIIVPPGTKAGGNYSQGILIDGTLTKAKQCATAEFGDGFAGHEIIILDNANGEVIARRRIGSRGWQS
jgi:hypothetical protein